MPTALEPVHCPDRKTISVVNSPSHQQSATVFRMEIGSSKALRGSQRLHLYYEQVVRPLLTTPAACYRDINFLAYCLKDMKQTHIERLEFDSKSGL